jgi:hypothetical protein
VEALVDKRVAGALPFRHGSIDAESTIVTGEPSCALTASESRVDTFTYVNADRLHSDSRSPG